MADVNTPQDSGENIVDLAGIGAGAANEAQTLSITAILRDAAGNSTTGTESATTLDIDQDAPIELVVDETIPF